MPLMFVETPLQLFCAYEAASREPGKARFVLRFTGVGRNDIQLRGVAQALGIRYQTVTVRVEHVLLDMVVNAFFLTSVILSSRGKVFLGSYFSRFFRFLARLVRRERLFFLDDGVATYWAQREMRASGSFFNVFTFFQLLPAPGQTVIRHRFERFRESFALTSLPSSGCYFIGQPLVDKGMVEEEEYLSIVAAAARVQPPLIYIPHRVESEEFLARLEAIKGVVVKPINVCVEMFFTMEKTLPKAVSSCYSSALFSLCHLLPRTQFYYAIPESLATDLVPHLSDIMEALDNERRLSKMNVSEDTAGGQSTKGESQG